LIDNLENVRAIEKVTISLKKIRVVIEMNKEKPAEKIHQGFNIDSIPIWLLIPIGIIVIFFGMKSFEGTLEKHLLDEEI